jgi:biotin transport system substrate-specific component
MKISTRDLILTSLFTALMVAGAFVRIPFPLLPVTLQAFICALAGLIIGPRLGALSMTIYAMLGLTGIPVFAQGGGITYIFNKSFGFIVGFIAGAYVIGKISRYCEKPTKVNNIKSVMTGLFIIYILGITYMLVIIRLYLGNTQVGFWYVLTSNIPYFIKDFILFIAAAVASSSIMPLLSKARSQ